MSIISSELLLGAAGAAGGYEIERSVRFNSADSAYLNRTPSSAGNRKTWTWAGWVKFSAFTGPYGIFEAPLQGGAGILSDITEIWYGSGNIHLTDFSTYFFSSEAKFRDPSAWQHFVFTCDTTQATASNRFKAYQNGVQLVNTASAVITQNIDTAINNSVPHIIGRNRGSSYTDAYFADIHLIDGQALDPTSFGEFDDNGIWQPKAYSGSYGTNGFHLPFNNNSTAAALGTDTSGNGNDWTVNNINVGATSVTNPAWYASSTYYSNVADVLANATNKGSGSWTASNEYVYLVVNDGGNPGINNVSAGNFPITWYMYRNVGGTLTRQGSFLGTEFNLFDWSNVFDTDTISNNADFYIFSSIDQNPPTSGQLSGTIPALTTSSFKTLNIINAGNDSLIDSPVNGTQTDTGAGGEVSGNYCTFSPIDSTSGITLTDGNLRVGQLAGADKSTCGTFGVSSGKWYWEFQPVSGINAMVGVADLGLPLTSRVYPGAGAFFYYQSNGNIYGPTLAGTSGAYGASFQLTSDVVGVALDMDTGYVTFYKNGVSQGVANTSSLLGRTITPCLGNGGVDVVDVVNFGQRLFAYTAPSGYKALTIANFE